MSDQGAPPVMVVVTLEETMQACLRAVKALAEDATLGTQGKLGPDALAFAQAHVILDPQRLQGGDTAQARVDATPPAAEAPQGGAK